MLVGAVKPGDTPRGYADQFNFTATLAALEAPNGAARQPLGSAYTQASKPYRYSNAVMIRGSQTGEFAQRVPVPLGMWRPSTGGGVALNLAGPGTIQVSGKKVAVVICYEQLITWPVLVSFLDHPSLVVSLSNNGWVSATDLPKIEQTAMQAWADLFHVSVLFAANW